jgi:hypothetical protein
MSAFTTFGHGIGHLFYDLSVVIFPEREAQGANKMPEASGQADADGSTAAATLPGRGAPQPKEVAQGAGQRRVRIAVLNCEDAAKWSDHIALLRQVPACVARPREGATARTRMHACMQACMHACKHASMHACMQACMRSVCALPSASPRLCGVRREGEELRRTRRAGVRCRRRG